MAPPKLEEEEDEGSAGEEVEEVTRCICGNVDLQTDEDYEDTGLFVQCDNCLVWQHGYCVGLLNHSQMPETYHCELCRPDLHQIIQRPRKPRRSKYLGVDGAAPSPPFPLPEEPVEDLDSGPRKRRSTMNSRDAAYDRQLEAALLLSAQQDGVAHDVAPPSISARSSRSVRRRSPSLSKRGRTPSPSPPREEPQQKKRKKGGAASRSHAKKEESVPKEEFSNSRKRSNKKKSGSASTPNDGNDEASIDGASSESSRPKSGSHANSANQSSFAMPAAPALAVSHSESRAVSRAASRESTPIPTANNRKRGGTRNSKKISTPSSSRIATLTMSGSTALPSTPNGKLHALSEMRKRVSAILEYVARIQEEMTNERADWQAFLPPHHKQKSTTAGADQGIEHNGKTTPNGVGKQESNEEENDEDDDDDDTNSGFELVDNKRRKDDWVWGYGFSEGGSVELIEELTSNLLRWESQYG